MTPSQFGIFYQQINNHSPTLGEALPYGDDYILLTTQYNAHEWEISCHCRITHKVIWLVRYRAYGNHLTLYGDKAAIESAMLYCKMKFA